VSFAQLLTAATGRPLRDMIAIVSNVQRNFADQIRALCHILKRSVNSTWELLASLDL
jgi:hypothetical protein